MKNQIYRRTVKLSFRPAVSALLAVFLLAAPVSTRRTSAESQSPSASGRSDAKPRSILAARSNRRPSPREIIFSEDSHSEAQLQERLLDRERMTRSQEIARERDVPAQSTASKSTSKEQQSARAQNSSSNLRLTFRDIGPETGYSGSGTGFTFNRDTSQVILPSRQRVFRSVNGGNNWSPLTDLATDPIGNSLFLSTDGSYFVRQDPRDPQVVYAVTANSGRLVRSNDFGSTWTPLGDGSFDSLADVAVHEASLNILLALKTRSNEFYGPALWRSEDRGATWEPQWNSGLPTESFDSDTGELCDVAYSNIATTPADPNVVYVVQSRGSDILDGNFRCPAGVHKSTDGGLTFAPLEATSEVEAEAPGRTFGGPIQVFPHPTRPEVLFVQTDYPFNSSIYRSIDGGASFQPVGGGLTNENFFVSFDPHDPSLVYVAGRRGVFRSQDDGETFQPLGVTAEQLGSFATNVNVDPSNSKTIFVNTFNGNFKSNNGGATFRALSNGWRAADIRAIAFDNREDPTLYLATDHGITRTSTRGHVYERVPHPSALYDTRLITVAPSDPNMILAVTRRGALYRTLDGGQTWIEASIDTPDPDYLFVSAMAVDPQNSKNVYFVGNEDFYRSVDAGASFERILVVEPSGQQVDFSALAIDPIHTNIIFAGGTAIVPGPLPLSRSADGGLTFAPAGRQDVTHPSITNQIRIDPQNPNNIFLLGGFTFSREFPFVRHLVIRSTDGGATFSPADAGLPSYETGFGQSCTDLVMNPEDPARLYCWSAWLGLSVTSDGANTWSLVPANEIAKVTRRETDVKDAMLINPKKPKLLYLLGNSLLEVEIHAD